MKKILLIFTMGLLLISCSSSDDNNTDTNTDNNVYFNFTFDGKNYSSNLDGGLLCMIAQPNQSGSEVNLLMNFKDPSDNATYCGVTLLGVNNNIGTTNNCTFGFQPGNDYITCNNLRVVLTEVGDYYVGTFSGNINVFSISPPRNETMAGSGSFRVRKSI
ncbi:hypothetical protein [Flavobacterium sp.]|uniref:hypothetical protein n=1 Tax=Flavobacterium sp. TaxID=239 RepID=UPI00334150C5